MREIKFRIFHKSTKQMVYLGSPWICTEYSSLAFQSSEDCPSIGGLPGAYTDDKLESYEVMQYTGLKDKNGKEIYEGDVIKFSILCYAFTGKFEAMTEKWKGVVVWLNRHASYGIDRMSLDITGCDEGIQYHWPAIICEVIGNIHENPKLLKEK